MRERKPKKPVIKLEDIDLEPYIEDLRRERQRVQDKLLELLKKLHTIEKEIENEERKTHRN